MNGVCESCGNHSLVRKMVEGIELLECELCEELHGDDAQVALVEERREGREKGFDPRVYPLVKALERVPTFRIAGADAGGGEGTGYPYVFLRLAPGGLVHLERLLTSLEMANRETRRRWVVEASLQRGLLFILRPRFWKPVLAITKEDVADSQADLDVLARVLRRDVELAWWNAP